MLERDEATTKLLSRALAGDAPVTSPTLTFVVTQGPDAGMEVAIEDAAHRLVIMGHAPGCDVRVTDPTTSRRHASFEVDAAGIRLRDMRSRNGTFVGAMRVFDVLLAGNEIVRVGGTSFRVVRQAGEHPIASSNDAYFGNFIGASPALRRLYPLFERVAESTSTVLIEGEAGTGKELLAEILHDIGPRRAGPFVVFDRGTSSPLAAEIALFGQESASGGVERGVLERANGGTIFFDEIADLETPLQVKLLRTLERRELRRAGGSSAIPIDVRVLAASRRNLDRDVSDRTFREELLQFLSTVRFRVPPLRQRRGDITLLTRFFWGRFGSDPTLIPPTLLQRFEEHEWPGNVRELMNAVARHLASGDAELADATPQTPSGDFLDRIVEEGLPFPRAKERVATEFQRRYVQHALDRCGGNVTRAAATSGIGRRYFHMLKTRD